MSKIFIADFKNKVVRERPILRQPSCWDGVTGEHCLLCKEYRNHLASLKSYPANFLTKEMDGKELVEGKDFELKAAPDTGYTTKGEPHFKIAVKLSKINAGAMNRKFERLTGIYNARQENEYHLPLPDVQQGKEDVIIINRAIYDNFQTRVDKWLLECFGETIARDKQERNHRFIEEALELVQSCGATESECQQLVSYVFGRPVGEMNQEVGGVMVTLAALCLAQNTSMDEQGEVELKRIWGKIDKIREKQAAKPKHSPLPSTTPSSSPVEAAKELKEWIEREANIHAGQSKLFNLDIYKSFIVGATAVFNHLQSKETPSILPDRKVFNEQSLRNDIIKVWGEFGAHCDVYDTILKQNKSFRDKLQRLLDKHGYESIAEVLAGASWQASQPGEAVEFAEWIVNEDYIPIWPSNKNKGKWRDSKANEFWTSELYQLFTQSKQ